MKQNKNCAPHAHPLSGRKSIKPGLLNRISIVDYQWLTQYGPNSPITRLS